MPNERTSLLQYLYETEVLSSNNSYNPQKSRKYVKNNILDTIHNLTPKCQGSSIAERVYWILHDLEKYPKNCHCGNSITTWHSWKNPYKSEYCSKKCAVTSDTVQRKIVETNIERYGVERPAQNKKIRKKIKSTTLKKYGADNVFKVKDFQDKIKDTLLEKYGVDNVSKIKEVKEKKKATSLKNYGVEYPSQAVEIKQKVLNTHIERYGRHFNNHEKAKNTLTEKYGVTNPRYIKESNQKFIETYIKKLQESYPVLTDHDYITSELKRKTVLELSAEIGCAFSTLYNYIYKNGIPFQKFKSGLEKKISSFLDENNITYIKNDRTVISPKELDFYLPDYNLAIELNGIYWHSEINGKNRTYLLSKSLECQDKGIKLLHVFENELIDQEDIVYSRISNILNLNKSLYARKCIVRELSTNERNKFFNKNHIQGDIPATVSFGLYYGNDLVAAMSFGKSRFSKKYEWELLRFCSKLNTNVIGGAGKLFKHFTRVYEPSSIVSYADRRWGEGNFYMHLGFEYSHSSSPNYWYFKNDSTLYSRNKFQKHKLSSLLEDYDESLSEWENMKKNGYDRIWDCGNNVYVWNHSPR